MRLGYSRFPPLVCPYDEFEGAQGGAAIQTAIIETTTGDTLYLPNRIYTLQTLIFDAPINVVMPPGGTKIYGSLAVQPRGLTVDDPGYGQISSDLRLQVRVVDLRQNGIPTWGGILPFENSSGGWQGGSNVIPLALPALMCNDSQMELTRWPEPSAVNEPWTFGAASSITIANQAFTDTSLPGWNPANWSANNRTAVTMYPGNDGGPSESYDFFSSATISYPGGTPTVALDNAIPTNSMSGPFYRDFGTLEVGTRYVVQNILEELTLPGQYYIDVNNLLIYMIPPADTLAHNYRLSWTTNDLIQLGSGCSGITFTGGPLGLYGSRAGGISAAADDITDVTFDNVQAYGIGMDAFNFARLNLTGWSIGTLVVEWCGGAGIWFGPTGGGPPPPALAAWDSHFGQIYLSQTCQWARTYRGGAHFNCVGCSIGYFTSVQNPSAHLIHDSHNFVIHGAYIDGSFMEAGDVGVVYSAEDPTIFGTVFNNFVIANIPNMTDNRPTAPNDRNGIYIDNVGSGVTVNNAFFYNCNSGAGSCIFVNGGQACTVNGVSTLSCASQPVSIGTAGTGASGPWSAGGYALVFYDDAPSEYATAYGTPWAEMPLSGDPYGPLGAPRNNSLLRIFPNADSTFQADMNSLGLGVAVNQPQGAVAAAQDPAAPYPKPQ